ncbi:MAG TPA: hypothetical protein VND65_10210 [Candidatus Binatia bacterium]|nr:hypothetical protein [Candidatus Binatia bacterium]
MKLRLGPGLVAIGILIGVAAAQSTQTHSSVNSSGKSGPDPLQTATKPLTPKSAMPAPRKTAPAAPSTRSNAKAGAELSRMERTNIKASNAASSTTKAPPVQASSGARPNPPIIYTYQQPTGGVKATTPAANSANSRVPRVTKPN